MGWRIIWKKIIAVTYSMQLLQLWKESLKFTYKRSRHRPLTDFSMIPTISLRILKGSCQRLLKDTCQWRSFKDPYIDPILEICLQFPQGSWQRSFKDPYKDPQFILAIKILIKILNIYPCNILKDPWGSWQSSCEDPWKDPFKIL